MNKLLLSVIITWVFIFFFILAIKSEDSKLYDIKNNAYNIEEKIDDISCKKIYKSGLIEMTINYNNNILTFFPDKWKQFSLSKRCKMQLEYYRNSKMLQATLLKDSMSSKPLDLYIDKEHIIIFSEELEKRKNSNRNGIYIALMFGILVSFINFLVWYYKIRIDKLVQSSNFKWILYFIAIFAIVSYIFT